MATTQPSTNIVPITSSPSFRRPKEAAQPEPLYRTPELAVCLAILETLPAKKRRRVSQWLFEKAAKYPEDDALSRASFHIGRLVR